MASSRLILDINKSVDNIVALPSTTIPQTVSCRAGDSAMVKFTNGSTCCGHCIRCSRRACLSYAKDELEFANKFLGFSPEHDFRVCPTDAITWDAKKCSPVIDPAKCINCGCCALRCPTRAIYFREGHFRVMLHSDALKSLFVIAPPTMLGPQYVLAETAFTHVTYSGCIVSESDALLNTIYGRIQKTIKRDPRIPNLLVRNLLLAIGIDAAHSRCGDVYSRTDILFSFAQKLGLCEVEFNDTMIDTPRDIIEDVAIYESRYGVQRRDILPLVVGLQYPNRRSEFWEVLTDIKNVLGISTRSLTVGALLLLAWNQRSLREGNSTAIPAVDNQHKGIKKEIVALLGRKVGLGNNILYNVLEPLK